MRQSLLTLAIPLFFLLGPSLLWATDDFMAADQLRRGMSGVGRTVFQGTTIDTFAVEILGVVRSGLGPRQDLILARLSGGPLAETGVIRGMSGSPVYVDGRLIGAVAYGWSSAKVPICGITPIHQMLQVMERDLTSPEPDDRAWTPIELDPAAAALVRRAATDAELSGSVSLEPLGTPVWVAGSTPVAAGILRDLLQPLGLHLLAGPGGQKDAEPGALEPGASLGVQLISGDMSATGIGTLTYIDGERVVGFGHPMMLAGATDMPMTAAYIYDVIPSRLSSFKLGAATRPIGAVRQDRAPAIAGVLGPAPAMLPVAVDVASASGAETFHFGIVRHPDLIPGFARSVLLSALEFTEKLFGDATIDLRTAIFLGDGQTLKREQIYSGPVAIMTAALEAALPLTVLTRNQFAPVHIDSLHFSLTLKERIDAARVRGLRVGAAEVEAGETFILRVTLEPYRRDPVEHQIEISLPANLAPGPLLLRVGSGAASRAWESQRRPDAFEPRDARQLLELLAYYERSDELIVELYRSESSLTIDGRELPGLPPSARAILEQGNSSGHLGPVYGQVIQRQRQRTDYVLSGEQTLELTVRKPRE